MCFFVDAVVKQEKKERSKSIKPRTSNCMINIISVKT